MRSTHSARPSSRSTRGTGGCSGRGRELPGRRSTHRLDRRRQVPPRPARRWPVRELQRARSSPRHPAPRPGTGSRSRRRRSRGGGALSEYARSGAHGRSGRQRILAAPESHVARCAARLRRRLCTGTGTATQSGRPSSPTGRPSTTRSPRAFRRPRTTASAGGGHSPRPSRPTPACSTRTRRSLADFLLSQFGTQTIAGHAVRRRLRPRSGPRPPAPTRSTLSRTTRRSPGWPPASSDSSFPTNSIRSRSTRRSPTIPRPGKGEEALGRPGVDLREPPPARPGRSTI